MNKVFIGIIVCIGLIMILASCQAAPLATSTQSPAAISSTETPIPPIERLNSGQIIFTSLRSSAGNLLIFIMDVDSRKVMELKTELWSVISAKWSPDGNKILVSAAAKDNEDFFLYIINANGSLQGRLSEIRGDLGDWSPDGKRVVFSSDQDNQERKADIYIIDADGKNLRKIVNSPATREFNMNWSPDGKKILYISNQSGKFELYTYTLDNSSIQKISDMDTDIKYAAWSPDGKQTAFVTKKGVYIADAEMKSKPVELISDQSSIQDITWSPDSSHIVYNAPSGDGLNLWMVEVGSGKRERLTDEPYDDIYPHWGYSTSLPPIVSSTPTPGIIKASDQPIKIQDYSIVIKYNGYINIGYNPMGGKSTMALNFSVTEETGKLDKIIALQALITDSQGKWTNTAFSESGTNKDGKPYLVYNIMTSDATVKYYLRFPTGEMIELPR
jgi:Tol biopolymer transport system component